MDAECGTYVKGINVGWGCGKQDAEEGTWT
jgi:hypothetical protein